MLLFGRKVCKGPRRYETIFTLEPDFHGDSRAVFDFARDHEKPCLHIQGGGGSSGGSPAHRD